MESHDEESKQLTIAGFDNNTTEMLAAIGGKVKAGQIGGSQDTSNNKENLLGPNGELDPDIPPAPIPLLDAEKTKLIQWRKDHKDSFSTKGDGKPYNRLPQGNKADRPLERYMVQHNLKPGNTNPPNDNIDTNH